AGGAPAEDATGGELADRDRAVRRSWRPGARPARVPGPSRGTSCRESDVSIWSVTTKRAPFAARDHEVAGDDGGGIRSRACAALGRAGGSEESISWSS